MSYHPGRLVTNFHHIPRFGYLADIVQIDNQQSARQYGIGVGINGAIILGVGLILLVVLLSSYFAVCCCRCCRCCKRAQGEDGRRYCRTSSIWLIVLTIILAGLGVGSAVVLARITKAILDTMDGAQVGVDVILNATDCKNTLLASAQDLTNLEAYIPYDAPPYKPQIDNAITEFNNGANSIPSIATRLTNFATDIRDHSHKYSHAGRAGAIALGFIPTLLGLLLLITLPKNRCCMHTFRFFAVLGLFVMALFWIIAAVLFPLSIAGADTCYDPDNGVYTKLNCANCYSNNNPFQCDVCYYAVCTDPSYSSFPEGTLHNSVVTARNNLQNGISNFNSLPAPNPAAQPTYDAAETDMNAALAEVDVLVADTTCAVMGDIYPNTRHNVCTSGISNVIALYILQMFMAVALFLLLAFALPLWNNHPAVVDDRTKAVPTVPTGVLVTNVPPMVGIVVPQHTGPVTLYQGEPGSPVPYGPPPTYIQSRLSQMDPYGIGAGGGAGGQSIEMQRLTTSPHDPLAYPDISHFQQPRNPAVSGDDAAKMKIAQDDATMFQPPPQGTAPPDHTNPLHVNSAPHHYK